MTEYCDDARAQASAIVFQLNIARKRLRVFPRNHPDVLEAIEALHAAVLDLLEACRVVTFSFVDREIYFEGQVLTEESLTYAELADDLNARGLMAVSFHEGLSADEVMRFTVSTNLDAADIEKQGGWEEVLRNESISHVGLRRVPLIGGTPGGTDEDTGPSEGNFRSDVREQGVVPQEIYRSVFAAVVDSFGELNAASRVELSRIQDLINMLIVGIMENRDVFTNLTTVKHRDQYTFFHCVNVAVLSLLMGAKLQFDGPLLNLVGTAAILHDIGKICLPEEILKKPGRFTADEWRIMQTHPIEGAKLLSALPNIETTAIVVAAQHHAHHNLTGYPSIHGIKRLHFLSELVAIADTFDAITTDQTYRKGLSAHRALEVIIEGRGTLYEPSLVNVFAQLVGLFPVGTLVELDTGEHAVVVRPNPEHLGRPAVRLLGENSEDLADAPVVELTERSRDGAYLRTVVKTIDAPGYRAEITSFLF